ncbi:endonuclease/exonuclease/phosphatase family protein [Agromyces seonyuensis]|uniref:Endonuclease/exonuclease/phosphatase family protein n=1 Tax=Agromyces seonyuensis TaxID=2662446 RepID=A0A6I4P0C7_9MICO|nr:endonuclease/exonuclease/phosphatase family protein [Agromyces seonyuensis]MWC00011.1 endonuclease/exonuclease/phosphatase family protein [Agromyces seonyuensis]
MHRRSRSSLLLSALAVGTAAALSVGALPAAAAPAQGGISKPRSTELRVATYNLSLNRATEGQLVADLTSGTNAQAKAVAEVIQRADADVILLNEFDYVEGGVAADLFRDNYLEVSQNGAAPVEYPYAFTAPSNTGIQSGFDLDNDGVTAGDPDDAFGFGLFPGQYGMAVLSKFPIDTDDVRTFQNFLWKDMPGALLPDDPATAAPNDWFTPEELAVVRLSSKSHWDVPIQVGRSSVHVLASHPTPPTFDGAEDRNGTRNHDEIRFWADYISPFKSRYIVDDAGKRGGIGLTEPFVILGDQNADPVDGDSTADAIDQLLGHPRLIDPKPTSAGAPEAAVLQGGANLTHLGDPKYDTADFTDNAPGNLRADYVLPSKVLLKVQGAGVFWVTQSDPLARLMPYNVTSDHRLVWVDLTVPGWTGWIS